MEKITDVAFEQVLRRHLKYLGDGDELSPVSDLKALGLDSMASLNLLFDLEDTFDVELPDEYLVAETFATPKSLQDALNAVASA